MCSLRTSDTNSQTWEFLVIMNREKIKEIEQMTWDALHKLARKEKMEKRKQGNYLHVLSPYATAFGGTSINRMFGNTI